MNREQIAQQLAACIKVNSIYTQDCFEKILKLIDQKKKNYTCYDFICLGKFGPVLKVSETSSIKIVKVEKDNYEEIDRLEKLYHFFSQFEQNKYIVGVYDSYFLTEELNHQQTQLFYVSETELCDGMLTAYLKQLKQRNENLSDSLKQRLSIQLLDALNFFHSKGIQHRGVKQQSLFFKKEGDGNLTIKLSGYGCTESKSIAQKGTTYITQIGAMVLLENIQFYLKIFNSIKKYSILFENINSTLKPIITINIKQKGTQYYIPLEVLSNQFCIESDLFGLGILLLQIDNVEFDYSSVTAEEFLEVQNEVNQQPFASNKDIRKDSVIYSVATIFLKKIPKERTSINEGLKILFNSQIQNNWNQDLISSIKLAADACA